MRLSRLTIYPVKSVHGNDLAASKTDRFGLESDRRWAVVYPSGRVATRRELPRLALLSAVPTQDGISLSYEGTRIEVPFPTGAQGSVKIFNWTVEGVEDAGNYASHFLSSALEVGTRLVYFPETGVNEVDPTFAPKGHLTSFSDGFPILLITKPSIDELSAEVGEKVDMRRFRSNIVVDGDFEPWAEDTWRVIRIGSTVLRVVKSCERCVVTTQDPMTGEIENPREPLASLGRVHRAFNGKIIFGQNLIVEEEGNMVLGDEVEVLETGPSNLLDPKR
ncbi:MOSC domain-containing protein [Celeribacter arenosi]|uniref:MOSC domain-containing protein n=1 Tax=Celeribacter arenosi TaxID=792649 RepID=A0ABP7K0U2_9RHOB